MSANRRNTMNIVARLMARLPSLALLLAGFVSTASADPPLSTQCGAVIRSTTKTTTDPFTFTAETVVDIPNAAFFVSVPAGTTRCVVVTFSASARCPHACFVRAIETSSGLEPDIASNRFAQGDVHRAHTFQWAKRLPPGAHTVKIQIGRGNTLDDADIGPYTARLEFRE
jgi:hypothetical protein